MTTVEKFYDDFSDYYYLIFEDWQAEREYQAHVIDSLIKSALREPFPSILDVTCGIGTQSLGLAKLNYKVTGLDISSRAVQKAKEHAAIENLSIELTTADVRFLPNNLYGKFEVVISFDNSLPHLMSNEEILTALIEMRKCLKSGGSCLISIRDYEKEPGHGSVMKPYGIREFEGNKFALFQIWEYEGPTYNMTWYLVFFGQDKTPPSLKYFKSKYYTVTVSTMITLLEKAGFSEIKRLDNVFYQPVITAKSII